MGKPRKGFNCRYCGISLKWDESIKCGSCSTIAVKKTYQAIAAERRENREEVVVKEPKIEPFDENIIYSAKVIQETE